MRVVNAFRDIHNHFSIFILSLVHPELSEGQAMQFVRQSTHTHTQTTHLPFKCECAKAQGDENIITTISSFSHIE